MVHKAMMTTTNATGTAPTSTSPTLISTKIMPSCPRLPTVTTFIQPRPSPPTASASSSSPIPSTRYPSSSSSMMMISSSMEHEQRRHNRIRFALFIKVLLKLVEDKLIRDQTKSIVKSYVKKNKIVHHNHTSTSHMEEDMELPLRGLVGDDIWLCARHYTQLYFQQKSKRRVFPPPPSPSPTLTTSIKNQNDLLPHSVSILSSTTNMDSSSSFLTSSSKTSLAVAVPTATTTRSKDQDHHHQLVEEQQPDVTTSAAAAAVVRRNVSSSSSSNNIVSSESDGVVEDEDATSSSLSSENRCDDTMMMIQEEMDFLCKGYDDYMLLSSSPAESNHHDHPSLTSRPLPDSLTALLSLPPMKLIPNSSNHSSTDIMEDEEDHDDDDDEMDNSQRSRSSSLASFYVDDIPGNSNDALDELPSVFQQQHYQDSSKDNFPDWLTDDFLLVHPQPQHKEEANA